MGVTRYAIQYSGHGCSLVEFPGGGIVLYSDHAALREAVNRYFDCVAYAVAHPSTLDKMNAARAEVDRLLSE